ncbi:MAG: DEAD/DEAH box helicase family protein [Lachnospiraceae bacterium]|nr:DEAD/DEAH box helicase family protein [Lachnospiraceae bacterium]
MELKNFQIEASEQIAERYESYMSDPLYIRKNEIVPFYQNLSAITGAGKTLVLADAIEQMRTITTTQPIVLWLSKGRVVVGQTLENLSNGKYVDNIPSYVVKPLLECKSQDVLDDAKGLVLVATVGKFNQKDKEAGDRKIFQTGLDEASESLWEILKKRENDRGEQRELVIIYDEGHNLSDQQLDLLLELKPDALIAASATTKVPQRLEKYIDRLKSDNGMTDADLITAISNKAVVDSGLIKKHISLGGYLTPMEIALNGLLADMHDVEDLCEKYGCDFRPKAIYVSNTNVLAKTSQVDNIMVPFNERLARPIQIWKHLVEQGVSPDEIAVYCDLKFDKKFPKPDNFHLFSGGDNDYEEFIAGNYRHIIFNQSLQEGWDDPECYFAYIDKDMGSNTQVTQIIGRVLRQPGITHYPDDRLNMASFYIKTDEKEVFRDIIEEVKKTLSVEIPEINITYRVSSSGKTNRSSVSPRFQVELPDVAVNSCEAEKEIEKLMELMNDFNNDTTNTIGSGTTIRAIGTIGDNEGLIENEIETGHSNKVSVRWVFKRELGKLAKGALTLCDYSNPKFDALIEYSSNARNYLQEYAKKIADVYREKSVIVQNSLDTIEVGDICVNDSGIEFKNSIHPQYSDFNKFEKDFANELDKIGLKWMRNPSSGYFQIPLLDGKGTNNFNPDFVVWDDDEIYALDTKGNHLIIQDSERKLFFIDKAYDEGPDLLVRLISEKKYNSKGEIIDNKGYTVWKLKQGTVQPLHCDTLEDAVKMCLKK